MLDRVQPVLLLGPERPYADSDCGGATGECQVHHWRSSVIGPLDHRRSLLSVRHLGRSVDWRSIYVGWVRLTGSTGLACDVGCMWPRVPRYYTRKDWVEGRGSSEEASVVVRVNV